MVFTTPKVSSGGGGIQHETKGKGKKRFEMLLASMGNKHKEKGYTLLFKSITELILVPPSSGKKYLADLK